MSKELSRRLYDMDATVEKLFILDYQWIADALIEFLDELDPSKIVEMLSLDGVWVEWLTDCDRSELPELLEQLSEEKPGLVLFEVSGLVYEKRPDVEKCWSNTGSRAIEYGGCIGIENLDAAINEALDRMAPRLLRDAPAKAA